MARATRIFLPALALSLAGCLTFQTQRVDHPADAPGIYQFIEVDGVRIHLRDSGQRDREAVLLIHGYSSGISEWAANFDALATRYRVVAIDLMGFGDSDKPAGDYSPAAHAAMLARLMDKLGIERAHLLAHSWGTSVALAMALEHPARVGRVALICAWVYEEQLPTFFYLSRVPGVGEALYQLYYREQTDNRVADAFFDHRMATEALVDKIKLAYQRPGAVAAAHATARDMVFADMQQRYHRVVNPTLIISGRADTTSGVETGEQLAAQLPNARLRVYERSAHFPHAEQAATFNREVLEFFSPGMSPAPRPNPIVQPTSSPVSPERAPSSSPAPGSMPASAADAERDEETAR